ncbi:MAG: integration host factor subunit alpha [Alphaproteobacteria bacterium]|jgi:integration host factor subunit alpha|nr:integration host factor subunit alpha [Alphaproteobacteria bacterium]
MAREGEKKAGAVTRMDLAEAIVAQTGVPRADATRFTDALLQRISDALAAGETVKLARFGNFQARSKRERVGRNPKTGQEAPITPRRVVTFRPSQLLRQRVESPPSGTPRRERRD